MSKYLMSLILLANSILGLLLWKNKYADFLIKFSGAFAFFSCLIMAFIILITSPDIIY